MLKSFFSSKLCPRNWNSFGKHKDPDHGFRTIPFCQLLKLVCNETEMFFVLKKVVLLPLSLCSLRMLISVVSFQLWCMEMMVKATDGEASQYSLWLHH